MLNPIKPFEVGKRYKIRISDGPADSCFRNVIVVNVLEAPFAENAVFEYAFLGENQPGHGVRAGLLLVREAWEDEIVCTLDFIEPRVGGRYRISVMSREGKQYEEEVTVTARSAPDFYYDSPIGDIPFKAEQVLEEISPPPVNPTYVRNGETSVTVAKLEALAHATHWTPCPFCGGSINFEYGGLVDYVFCNDCKKQTVKAPESDKDTPDESAPGPPVGEAWERLVGKIVPNVESLAKRAAAAEARAVELNCELVEVRAELAEARGDTEPEPDASTGPVNIMDFAKARGGDTCPLCRAGTVQFNSHYGTTTCRCGAFARVGTEAVYIDNSGSMKPEAIAKHSSRERPKYTKVFWADTEVHTTRPKYQGGGSSTYILKHAKENGFRRIRIVTDDCDYLGFPGGAEARERAFHEMSAGLDIKMVIVQGR